jgi:lipopolysaccharide export system protein LptC
MKTLKRLLLLLLLSVLTLPAFSQDLLLANQETSAKSNTAKRADKVTPISQKTKVMVYDQYGNLEYETAVACHTPATEKLLPTGSVYLFTYKNTAYYMIEKASL